MGYLMISLTVFVAYFTFAWLTVGIKSSISDTYFHVKWPNITFRGYIAGISLPLLIYAHNLSTGMMVSASLILWVAAAPGSRDHKEDKIENRNHGIGALGGILAAFISFLVEFVDWHVFYKDLFFWDTVIFAIGAVLILPMGKFKKPVPNHTTWIEVWAYGVVITTLIIYELIKI